MHSFFSDPMSTGEFISAEVAIGASECTSNDTEAHLDPHACQERATYSAGISA